LTILYFNSNLHTKCFW